MVLHRNLGDKTRSQVAGDGFRRIRLSDSLQVRENEDACRDSEELNDQIRKDQTLLIERVDRRRNDRRDNKIQAVAQNRQYDQQQDQLLVRLQDRKQTWTLGLL